MRLLNAKQLLKKVRAAQGERTETQFAKDLGVSLQFLNRVLRGETKTPGTRIAAALGYEQVIRFRQNG